MPKETICEFHKKRTNANGYCWKCTEDEFDIVRDHMRRSFQEQDAEYAGN